MQDHDFGRNRQGDTWEKVGQIRDKFEYDREKRMREKGMFNAYNLLNVWSLIFLGINWSRGHSCRYK
jgi:hypothetical protein